MAKTKRAGSPGGQGSDLPQTREAPGQKRPLRGAQVKGVERTVRVRDGEGQRPDIRWEKESYLVGRESWCDIALDDEEVSRLHCTLSWEPEGILVEDAGSTNGTFLEGQRILKAYMSPGATLKVGSCALSLLEGDKSQELDVPYHDPTGTLVGKSPQMRKLFSLLRRLAQKNVPILLLGETGTGKSLIARAIHEMSPRCYGPFVRVNCGEKFATTGRSEFFGHEKGAFTGAQRDHPGFFEQAHGGTLFLDEIADLSSFLQVSLLHAIEDKKIRRMSSTEELDIDVRLIAATNKDLRVELEQKHFRQDLFFRLATFPVFLPPLRERMEDLPLLCEFLLQRLCVKHGESPRQLSPGAMQKLGGYLWPGNVRELDKVLERSLLKSDAAELGPEDIDIAASEYFLFPGSPEPLMEPQDTWLDALLAGFDPESSVLPLRELRQRFEKELIERMLQVHQGKVKLCAQTLELSTSRLYEIMEQQDIDPRKFRPS